MQGYFSYRLFGEKDDLVSALNTLKNKSKSDDDINELLKLIDPSTPISKYDDKYLLAIELLASGNINNFTFEFDQIAYDIADLFPNLHLSATGYFLDFLPYPIWTSPAGTSKVLETFEPIYIDIYLDDISSDTDISCPACQEHFTVNLLNEIENFTNENSTLEIEEYCDICDQPLILKIYN